MLYSAKKKAFPNYDAKLWCEANPTSLFFDAFTSIISDLAFVLLYTVSNYLPKKWNLQKYTSEEIE